MRRFSFAVLAIVVLSLQPAIAAPVRTPISAGGYVIHGPVRSVALGCSAQNADVAFDAVSVADDTGRVRLEGYALTDSISGGYLWVRRGSDTVGADLGEILPGPAGSVSVLLALPAGWTLRFAYASSGGETRCSASADDVAVDPVPALGRFATARDFDGEASVSSTAASFVADGSIRYDNGGHLFALLTTWSDGIPPLGSGTATVVRPDGRTDQGSSIFVNDAMTGRWSYRLSNTVTVPKTLFAAVELGAGACGISGCGD